jgi:hypothetical protein
MADLVAWEEMDHFRTNSVGYLVFVCRVCRQAESVLKKSGVSNVNPTLLIKAQNPLLKKYSYIDRANNEVTYSNELYLRYMKLASDPKRGRKANTSKHNGLRLIWSNTR